MLRFAGKKEVKAGTDKVLIFLILSITLAARLYYIYHYSSDKLSHDELGYHKMALQFLERGFLGYYAVEPNAFVTPGYPLFLSAVYFLAAILHSDLLISVRIVQVILSVFSVYLVYKIADLSGRPFAGIMAAVIFALYWPTFMAATRILTETTYTLVLLGYIYSVILAFNEGDLKWHALSGALMAATVLVRPAAVLFLPIPYIFQLIRSRDTKILNGLVISLILFCIVMTPWWVRNFVVFDKLIVFATQTGNPFLRGTDPYDPYDRIGPSIVAKIPENEMTHAAINRIKTGFRTNPWLWVKWFTVGKFSYLWLKPWGIYDPWAKMAHFGVFVVLGWLGVFTNLRNREMCWLALLVIAMTLVQMAFIPIERYMYPLTPMMAILASVFLSKIAQRYLTLLR